MYLGGTQRLTNQDCVSRVSRNITDFCFSGSRVRLPAEAQNLRSSAAEQLASKGPGFDSQ